MIKRVAYGLILAGSLTMASCAYDGVYYDYPSEVSIGVSSYPTYYPYYYYYRPYYHYRPHYYYRYYYNRPYYLHSYRSYGGW